MSKITTIKLTNFKAIEHLEIDFKGLTCIVTGRNNSGKTSFLRGIPDRIRFVRPGIMVKEGEKEGKGEMTLDTGEKFVWEFNNEGRDKLTLITDHGYKQSVTVEIGKQFFPTMFDIDKFLQSPPKKQSEQLQAIVGLDFTDIDKRYEVAYNERTERNRESERYHVKLAAMLRVDKVDFVDLTDLQARKEAEKNRLNYLYLANKKQNDDARNAWNKEKKEIDLATESFNKIQNEKRHKFNAATDALSILMSHGYSGDAEKFVLDLGKAIEKLKDAADLYPKEPEYITEMPDSSDLDKIDAEILAASQRNADATKYKDYIEYKASTEAAKEKAKEADELVLQIENERQRMIESAKMPQGISITPDGITVDGLPLDKNQISTSKLYTSALRIASMRLGDVKTLYFDASFLDKVSLGEIEDWANKEGFQLLIERPDFEAGEIKYELIENVD